MDKNNEIKVFPFELIKLPATPDNTKRQKDSYNVVYENKVSPLNVEPFIEKVKNALDTDLQDGNSFGCKIKECHTHAGSKIHFNSFVEAELLFHNSYYNERFASLTVNYIQNVFKEIRTEDKLDIENILLIGYEKYSELFLTTLRDKINERLKKQQQTIKHCEYCIYETNAIVKDGDRKEETSIRRLKVNEKSEINHNFLKVESGENSTKENNNSLIFTNNNTLCLFIVPINTSLSTMDKMVAKFINTVNGDDWLKKYLCLITLCSDNEFFDFIDAKENSLVYPKDMDEETIKYFIENLNGINYFLKAKKKFEYIAEQKIKNLVISKSNSLNASNCKYCFPVKKICNLSELLPETPMFGVNRGSVVPMLKFGHYGELKPIKQSVEETKKSGKKDIEEDTKSYFNRVWRLSQYMEYRHVSRGDNHFQFYFHTEKFLEKELNGNDIETWLNKVKSSYNDDNKCVFDYLVAPRHSTNAQFVYLVKSIVFNDKARIIFFDVNKEYRSNLTAKYSDLISAINNILSSNLDYEIRFHFVDDVINSGTGFLNAKNLISSIISETVAKNNRRNIHLFYDGILLINRMSKKRRNFYIPFEEAITRNKNYKNFHYFVNVNISPMRNYEDACTLCKLGYDYKKVRENCATNSLAKICTQIISVHKAQQYESVVEFKPTSLEKRYLFFITHLINERITNKFRFKFESQFFIETEKDYYAIKELLVDYYNFDNISKIFNEIVNPDYPYSICDQSFIWKLAFIKSISRPFFIYHIRNCQAAFSFCLKKLTDILSSLVELNVVSDDLIKNSICIQTLVKALADMNSNYIIRKDVLNKLIEWANLFICINGKLNEKVKEKKISKEEKDYIAKRLFKPESLLHYIKKDLMLSRDTTKSLLLEHILLEDKEDSFFTTKTGDDSDDKKFEIKVIDYFIEEDGQIGLKGKLYLENNLILRKTLQDDIDKLAIANSNDIDSLYFFENFSKVWRMNAGKKLFDSKDIFAAYKSILECLKGAIRNKKITEDFSKNINNLFDKLFDKLRVTKIKAQAFLFDKNEENELFQFFTVAGEPFESGDKYSNSNDCMFEGVLTSQAFFYNDNLEKIRKKINSENKEEDIFFIDNVLSEDFGKEGKSPESLIIRFGIDEEIGVNNHTNREVEQQKRKEQDNSIYFQIWGFNKEEPHHWFALKLLLTLRNNFVTLIKEINLQELIEERKVQMQKAALSIVKAVTHSSSNSFINYDICDINSNMDYRGNYSDSIHKPDNADIVFDKYFHVIANEYISSLYRKVIRNEECLFHKETFDADYVVTEMLAGICIDNKSNGNRVPVEKLFVFGDGIDGRASVKMEIDNTLKNEDVEMITWSKLDGHISALAHVLYLFAVNAAKYGKYENDYVQFKIGINDDGITFSNEYIGCKEKNERKLKKFTQIPPWVFKKGDQHITLWTLLQMNNRRKEDNYIYVKPSYCGTSYKITVYFNKRNEGVF